MLVNRYSMRSSRNNKYGYKKRNIYVFRNRNDNESNAIIINYSTDTSNELDKTYRKNIYLYTFNGHGNNISSDFINSKLEFRYGLSNSFTSYASDEYIDTESTFGFQESENIIKVDGSIDNMIGDLDEAYAELILLSPIYYNEKDFRNQNPLDYDDEEECNENFINISGHSLVDDDTDIITYNSTENFYIRSSNVIDYELSNSIQDVCYHIYLISLKGFFSKYIIAYQSGRGFNVESILMNSKQINYIRVGDYLKEIQNTLDKFAREMISDYGHFRLNLFYSNINIKIQIIFDNGIKIDSKISLGNLFDRFYTLKNEGYGMMTKLLTDNRKGSRDSYFSLT